MSLSVRTLLTRCVHGKCEDDYVFTREDGKPVREFRGALARVPRQECPVCSFMIFGGPLLGIFAGLESPKA